MQGEVLGKQIVGLIKTKQASKKREHVRKGPRRFLGSALPGLKSQLEGSIPVGDAPSVSRYQRERSHLTPGGQDGGEGREETHLSALGFFSSPDLTHCSSTIFPLPKLCPIFESQALPWERAERDTAGAGDQPWPCGWCGVSRLALTVFPLEPRALTVVSEVCRALKLMAARCPGSFSLLNSYFSLVPVSSPGLVKGQKLARESSPSPCEV